MQNSLFSDKYISNELHPITQYNTCASEILTTTVLKSSLSASLLGGQWNKRIFCLIYTHRHWYFRLGWHHVPSKASPLQCIFCVYKWFSFACVKFWEMSFHFKFMLMITFSKYPVRYYYVYKMALITEARSRSVI